VSRGSEDGSFLDEAVGEGAGQRDGVAGRSPPGQAGEGVGKEGEPNDESGANVDASKMWRDDREQFYKIAKQIVQKSLGL
ncbi:hypothetical protein P7K49_032419, partial [Saguinus oedipus]